MKRLIVCAMAFLLSAGVTLADDAKKADTKATAKKADEKKKKKAGNITGRVKSVDAEKGILVVMVGKKDEAKEKEFKIGDDAKFTVVISDTEKKEGLAAKDGFKAEQLKAGATVSLTMDGDKVTAVTVAQAKKKKSK